jgi:DNA modification methylase
MEPYYADASVTLYHGDCRELLPQIGPVDHVVTDPPYSDETHGKTWRSKMMADQGYQRVSAAYDGLGFAAITDADVALFSEWCAQNCRRWLIAFTDIEGVDRWIKAVRGSGLEYVRTCMWDKVDGTPQLTGDRPAVGAEAIVCAHPKGRKRWNGGGKRGVYRHAMNGERGVKPHPSTKPTALMLELLTDFTDMDERILDPFSGSGSTLVAAKRCGRVAIGIEQDEQHCESAAKRLEMRIDGPLFMGVTA